MHFLLSLLLLLLVSHTTAGEAASGKNLVALAAAGHNAKLYESIQSGADVNTVDEQNRSLLFVAAANDQFDTIKMLLKLGADPSIKTTQGLTPISISFSNNHSKIVQYLLENLSSKINIQGFEGWNHLHYAAYQGGAAVVSKLISQGYKVNSAANHGITPLYIAAEQGQTQTVVALLANGANPNQRLIDQSTPLMVAAEQGHEEIVKLLLVAKANVNFKNTVGATPLAVAAQNGHHKIVSLLLLAKADYSTTLEDGISPLHLAAINGNLATMRELIYFGANPNISSIDKRTPLWLASQYNHVAMVHELLNNQTIKVNESTNDGMTPLHIAAKQGNLNVVKLLLQHKASVKSNDNRGFMPIHYAAQAGHLAITSLLFKMSNKPVDIHAKANGATPLFLAAQQGNYDVTKQLLSFNADPNLTIYINSKPTTAMCAASNAGYVDVVKLFLNSGYTADGKYCQVVPVSLSKVSNIVKISKS